MKLVTFNRLNSRNQEIGIVIDTQIAVLDGDDNPQFSSMLALIEAGPEGLEAARQAMPACEHVQQSDVRLLAPLPRPVQMRDALTFEKHLRQARANRYLFDPKQPDLV